MPENLRQKSKLNKLFGYDAIGQVTTIHYNTPDINNPNLSQKDETFSYDPVGNRQTQVVTTNQVNSQTTYTANNLNQYNQAINGQPLAFDYDYNGNLKTVMNNQSPVASYQYDSQNRLVYASNANAVVNFSYDARNRCVKREIDGKVTYYIWDNWNLIEERGSNAKVVYRYYAATNSRNCASYD